MKIAFTGNLNIREIGNKICGKVNCLNTCILNHENYSSDLFFEWPYLTFETFIYLVILLNSKRPQRWLQVNQSQFIDGETSFAFSNASSVL